jgi:hypothetical protein
MEEAELARIREQFAREVRDRFPGAPIEVLQHGDDPEVEPGELLAKVIITAPADETGRRQAFEAFHEEHRTALRDFRSELNKLPARVILQFTTTGEPGDGTSKPVIRLAHSRGGPGTDGALTPVMARLGADDLETLDTLITAGIATSRADAVRWALARIRDRPAFDQIRAHTREIENLKSQF